MALAIMAAPVIARLFVPEDYGIAALYLSIVTIGAGVLPLGYQRAILFPSHEEVSAKLLVLAVAVSVCLTAVFYFVLGVAVATGLNIGKLGGLTGVLWLLPLGAFLLAVRDIMAVALLRRNAFSSIAVIDLGQSGTLVGSRILWGIFYGSAALGLILGHLISLAGAILLALRKSGPWLRNMTDGLSPKGMWHLAVEYQDYPRFRVLARLAFIVANQAPVLALGIMYPPATVGFFAMANRVVGMPMRATSQALSDAILRRSIGHRHESQPIGSGIWQAGLALFGIGLPGLALVHYFGSEALTWMLGERWFEAGEMLEILSIYIFSYWVASPFSTVFETLRKNRLQLLFHSANLVATGATFLICYLLSLDVYRTLWSYAIVCCLHQSVLIATAVHVARKHDNGLSLESGRRGPSRVSHK